MLEKIKEIIIKEKVNCSILLTATILYTLWFFSPMSGQNAGNEAYYIVRVTHITNGGSYYDGLFDNFPLYTYTLFLYSKLVGISVLSFRLVSVFCLFIATFFTYKIGVILKDRKVAFLAISLFLFFPLVSFFGIKIGIDTFAVSLCVLAIYFTILAVKNDSRYYILSGIFLGLAVFAKLPFFVIAFPIFYYMYINKTKLRYYLLLIIEGGLIILPWSLYTLIMKPEFINNLVDSSSNLFGLGMIMLRSPLRQMVATTTGILVLVLLLIIWKKYKPVTNEEKLILSIAFAFSLLYLAIPNHYYYFLPLFIPLFLYLSVKQVKWLKEMLVIFIIISISIFGMCKIYVMDETNQVVEHINENYDESVRIYSTNAFMLNYRTGQRYNITSIPRVDNSIKDYNNSVIMFTTTEKGDLTMSGGLDVLEYFNFAKSIGGVQIYESEDL